MLFLPGKGPAGRRAGGRHEQLGVGHPLGRTPSHPQPEERLAASDSEASENAVVVDGAGELLEVHVRPREVVLDAPQLGYHNADTPPALTPQVYYEERQVSEIGAHNEGFQGARELMHPRTLPPTR